MTATANRSEITRGSFWADQEVKGLIKIWGEENIQDELDGAVRNRAVFSNIAKQLNDLGYRRTWEQCKTKIKNLKKKYKDVKDHNGEMGRGRKTCKFFAELDEILGHLPASAPSFVLDTGSRANTEASSSAADDPNDSEEENLTNGMSCRYHHPQCIKQGDHLDIII